jgi:hypothetical protein
MSTPRHRADAVEDTSRAPTSARHPTSDTPIFEALVGELAAQKGIGWPVVEPDPLPDPDPPTERFRAPQFLDGRVDPVSDVEHREPMNSLFRNPLVDA